MTCRNLYGTLNEVFEMAHVNLDDFCFYAKVFGERNTGTNFVEQLLQENFVACRLFGFNRIHQHLRKHLQSVPEEERGRLRSAALDLDCARMLYSDFGWKHGVPPFEAIESAPHAQNTLFIAVAKHPVAWLKSLMERPYNPVEHAPNEFAEFIRHDWELTARDKLAGRTRINVVELWNVKNAAFRKLEQATKRSIVVAYEDILIDPQRFLSRVAQHLPRAKGDFDWQIASTKDDDLTFNDYVRKYDPDRVCAGIADDDIAYIKARVDAQLVSSFGYAWPA